MILRGDYDYELKDMSYWRRSLIWVLKVNLILLAVNVIVFATLRLSFGWATSGFFSIIFLLETGVSFLVGGAIAFSGSALPSKMLKKKEEWSIDKLRGSEKKANKYLILAVFLFVECLIAAFLGA